MTGPPIRGGCERPTGLVAAALKRGFENCSNARASMRFTRNTMTRAHLSHAAAPSTV